MPFVKLDCGILDSTLWLERESRDVFLTALLMAVPHQLRKPTPQIHVDSLKKTGWIVPAGWFGFVRAAGPGVIKKAGLSSAAGMRALRRLGEPEAESRSTDYDGRRMVRVDGGFIVLNYMRYRDRDYTAAKRAKAYRKRKSASRRDGGVTSRNVTQAEADLEADHVDLAPSSTEILTERVARVKKDQDHRADAQNANSKAVLVRIAHQAIAETTSDPDARDHMKTIASRAGLTYSGGDINRAMDVALHQRGGRA